METPKLRNYTRTCLALRFV